MQTLQSFCLNRIATSFDRYHYVYSTTKNEDLQGALLFLQRFYSHELVTRLNRGYRLKEKHADFIFNKFLKYMDTDWLTNFSWDGIVNIFERIGPNLESVRISRVKNQRRRYLPWKDVVCHLPELKVLNCLFCDDDMLRNAAMYCRKLEKLDIRGLGVTDSGLKYFCGTLKRKRGAREEEAGVPCPSLREISAIDTLAQGEAIEQLLKHLRSLEELKHVWVPRILHKVHKTDLLSLHKVERYNLKSLDLSFGIMHSDKAYYDEILRIALTLCPKLQCLTCFVFKLEHFTFFSQLSDLEDLVLLSKNSSLDVSDLLKQKGKKLTRLHVRDCIVSLSALGQCCQSLLCMRLDCVSILCSDNDSTCVFNNLKNVFCTNLVDLKALSNILTSSPILENLFFVYRDTLNFEMMKSGILECCEQTVAHNIFFLSDTDVKTEFMKEVISTCSIQKTWTFTARRGLRDVRRFAKTLTSRPRIKMFDFEGGCLKIEMDPWNSLLKKTRQELVLFW